MTTLTHIKTISPDLALGAQTSSATLLRCSIWPAGLRLHPVGNATGSRDAP